MIQAAAAASHKHVSIATCCTPQNLTGSVWTVWCFGAGPYNNKFGIVRTA
jgi:hypothetical protein